MKTIIGCCAVLALTTGMAEAAMEKSGQSTLSPSIVTSSIHTAPVSGTPPNASDVDTEHAGSDVQNLTMVDGIERFKRSYFLKNASIHMKDWIDNRRILALAMDAPSNRAHPALEPRVYVVIDTETGAIERPWDAHMDVKCLKNGRIILWERLSSELQGMCESLANSSPNILSPLQRV